MLLKSLLYKQNNRFYFGVPKSISVALLYLSFIITFNAFAESDFDLGDNDLIFLSGLKDAMSDDSVNKADALANYALGFIEFKKSFSVSPKALQSFLNSLKKDPSAATPLSILRRHWIATKKNDELIEKLLPIAKKNPSAFKLNIVVARSLEQEKRDDEALALLSRSLESIGFTDKEIATDAQRAEILLNIVLLYGKNKEWDKGEELLDEAFEYDGMRDSLTARVAAAKFYSLCADQGPDGFFAGWHKRRYREKLEKNLSLVEKKCESTKIRIMSIFPILEIYKRYSMGGRAENLLLSQLLLQPNDTHVFIILAKVLDDNEKFTDAFRAWKIIVNTSRYPNIKKIWGKVSILLNLNRNLDYQLGYAALRSGNWEEAVKAFDWGLLKNPNEPTGLFQLGYAYLKMGKYRKAIYKFEKVNAIPDSIYFMAHCYRKLGEFDKALEAMQKAENLAEINKQKDFLSPDFYMELAFIADKAKKLDITEQVLMKLLKETPEDANLNNFLGYLWADNNKNLDKAHKLIQKALNEEPENSAYLDTMAWVLYRQKEYKKALDYIQESLDNNEAPLPDAVISDHAGDIHAALGNKKEALKYWKLALETYSTDIDPEKIEKKIESLKKSN